MPALISHALQAECSRVFAKQVLNLFHAWPTCKRIKHLPPLPACGICLSACHNGKLWALSLCRMPWLFFQGSFSPRLVHSLSIMSRWQCQDLIFSVFHNGLSLRRILNLMIGNSVWCHRRKHGTRLLNTFEY